MRCVKKCKVDKCEGVSRGLGYCNKHYIQHHRNGKITPVVAPDLDGEVWVDICGSESSQVSDFGRVRKKYNYGYRLNTISVVTTTSKNLSVSYKELGGHRVHRQVKVLVAKHFLPKSGGRVLLIDKDYRNCKLDNLVFTQDCRKVASRETIERYKLFTSDIGVAAYEYLAGDEETIYKELLKVRESIEGSLGCRWTGGNDYGSYFMDGLHAFVTKLPTGFIVHESNLVGLLLKECQFAGLRASYNHKEVSTQSWDDSGGGRSLLDDNVYCDIHGDKCEYGEWL